MHTQTQASAPVAGRERAVREQRFPDLVPHATLPYRFGTAFCRVNLKLFCRLSVEGRERLPLHGGVLLLANHQSFLDIPAIASSTSRHVCFVARDSLADFKPLGWLMRRSGAVLVKRGSADRTALEEMAAHLAAGDCVAIFPEGTRSADGTVGEFRAGALLVARRAKVPVLPVGIRGTFDAWPRQRSLPRPARVAVRFGPRLLDASAADCLEQAQQSIVAMVGAGHYHSVPPEPS